MAKHDHFVLDEFFAIFFFAWNEAHKNHANITIHFETLKSCHSQVFRKAQKHLIFRVGHRGS